MQESQDGLVAKCKVVVPITISSNEIGLSPMLASSLEAVIIAKAYIDRVRRQNLLSAIAYRPSGRNLVTQYFFRFAVRWL